MSEAVEALRELAGVGKTKRVVQESAALTANYLDELLKQPGDTIALPRMTVVGMQSVLRSASKDHEEARHG